MAESAPPARFGSVSFVPVTGTATFRAAQPPRDGVVEFTDERRTVALPIRAALPVLTKAHSRDDLHPSVGLLSGAALLGLRLVAAGQIEPAGDEPSWRMGPLTADDEDRVLPPRRGAGARRARGRRGRGRRARGARRGRRRDAAGRTDRPAAPAGGATATSSTGCANGSALRRAAARAAPAGADLAAGRGRRGGAGRRRRCGWCSRSTTSRTPCTSATPRCCGPPTTEHGFGDRARTHAAIALRGAAEAWPVLDRLLELRVPDQITLDGDELDSLLEHGVAALAGRGVDVLWPRSLGRDLTASTVLDRSRPMSEREAQLRTGIFGEDELFSFRWQLAVHGDPLTDEEMDQLATQRGAAAAAARQLDGHRPGDRPQGPQAGDPHGHAGRGDRGGADRHGPARHRGAAGRGAGHPRCLAAAGPRAAAPRRASRSRSRCRPGCTARSATTSGRG